MKIGQPMKNNKPTISFFLAKFVVKIILNRLINKLIARRTQQQRHGLSEGRPAPYKRLQNSEQVSLSFSCEHFDPKVVLKVRYILWKIKSVGHSQLLQRFANSKKKPLDDYERSSPTKVPQYGFEAIFNFQPGNFF